MAGLAAAGKPSIAQHVEVGEHVLPPDPIGFGNSQLGEIPEIVLQVARVGVHRISGKSALRTQIGDEQIKGALHERSTLTPPGGVGKETPCLAKHRPGWIDLCLSRSTEGPRGPSCCFFQDAWSFKRTFRLNGLDSGSRRCNQCRRCCNACWRQTRGSGGVGVLRCDPGSHRGGQKGKGSLTNTESRAMSPLTK